MSLRPFSSVFMAAALFTAAVGAQSVVKKLDFGPGMTASGYTQVLAGHSYDKSTGFGFEPGASVTCTDHGGKDVLRSDLCSSEKPFYFSVAVPEGNYRVSITFGDPKTATSTVVKAELRRLMIEKVETAIGKFATKTFLVNVRTPQISTSGEVKLKEIQRISQIATSFPKVSSLTKLN